MGDGRLARRLIVARQVAKARPDRRTIAERRLLRLLEAWAVEITGEMAAALERSRSVELAVGLIDPQPVTEIVSAQVVDFAAESRLAMQRRLRVGFDELPLEAIRFIEESVFTASASTMQALRGDVLGQLRGVLRDGGGIREAIEQIRDNFPGFAKFQLQRIARTELHQAQNVTGFQVMRENDVQYVQWQTSLDDRVRQSHEPLHMEIVATGVQFSNGLRYPGERSGPIAEWINCRCISVPFFMGRDRVPPSRGPFFEYELTSAVAA